MTSKPQLLFVSPRFLFPMNEGGKIRTANTLRHMKGGAFEIVLASPAPPDVARYAADIAAAWRRIRSSVRDWNDLEPELIGRVEELIDFVTVGHE